MVGGGGTAGWFIGWKVSSSGAVTYYYERSKNKGERPLNEEVILYVKEHSKGY